MLKNNNSQTVASLADKFINTDPAGAAYFLENLPTHEALQILQGLKAETLVLCLQNMCAKRSAPVLRRFPVKQAGHILLKLPPSAAAEIMSCLPQHYKEKVTAELPKSYIKELETALSYPCDSAGALMRREFFAFRTDDKIQDILDVLKRLPRKKLPGQIYILDKQGRLAGAVKCVSLAFLAADASAGSIMAEPFKTDAVTAKKQLLELFKTGAEEAAVVNKENVLLGVVKPAALLQSHKDACRGEHKPLEYRLRRWVIALIAAVAVAGLFFLIRG